MAVLRVPDEFQTISEAVAAAVSGDTILVEPGVYREKVPISTDFVRVIANKSTVVLDGSGELPHGFLIKEAQGVEINGFLLSPEPKRDSPEPLARHRTLPSEHVRGSQPTSGK